jgi:hypothetical protein
VSGRHIESSRITWGKQPRWRSSHEADRFLERYIVRESVVVYYDPNDATRSVLEPEGGHLGPIEWAGILFIFLGLSILMVYVRVFSIAPASRSDCMLA